MASTAEERLERILYILPAAARGNGVAIDELARALEVDQSVVLQDIEHITARSYYQPAGTVEQFTIRITPRRIRVDAPVEFRRPVRLSQRETLSLMLGLRALAADEPERRTHILELAHRLEAELIAPDLTVREMSVDYDARAARRLAETRPSLYAETATPAPPTDVEYDDYAIAFDDDGFRGAVADAIEQQRTCTIWYLKPGDLTPMHRVIAPYRLVYAEGMWYVAAYDLEREAMRFFRMDRVLDAVIGNDPVPAAPPELQSLLAQGAPYSASDDVEVQVRYSPRVARWIIERTAAPLEHDGSVVIRHRVADPHWLARHVLQYAGEAVVEEPPLARYWVAAAADTFLVTNEDHDE